MEIWKPKHKEIIDDFLQYLNRKNRDYVLKGGTALMECYGLNRMSEDIDLDGTDKESISDIVKSYCGDRGFKYRIAKDTDTVKRFFINYGNDSHPLKIEISYRQKTIQGSKKTTINGINVYSVESIAVMKASAYNARDKLRDLNDITFIVNNYSGLLSAPCLALVSDALSFKGLEQFDYLTKVQEDELIDVEKLAEDFLQAWDKLGLIGGQKPEQQPEIQNMEAAWHEYFDDANTARNGIPWDGKKVRPAVFEDMYLGKCGEAQVQPDKKIYDHFWNNCVRYQGYAPEFCVKGSGKEI